MSKSNHPRAKQINDFICAHRPYWQHKKKRLQAKNIILRFETWQLEKNISIEALTPEHLEQFLANGKYKVLQKNTCGNYRTFIRRYICWLKEKHKIDFQYFKTLVPDAELKQAMDLPQNGSEYLAAQKPHLPYDRFIGLRATLIRFHICLSQENINIIDINEITFLKFSKYLRARGLSSGTRLISMIYLRKYLEWLREYKSLNVEFEEYLPRAKDAFLKNLTEDNKLFLKQLATTLRASTCSDYRGGLSQFNQFLAENRMTIENLDRSCIESWLQFLHGKSHSITTQRQKIIRLRVHLRWLFDRGTLSCHPDLLIKFNDLPKSPRFLPRPIPREIDLMIINRLEKSCDINHKGLLLMRRTGLRIGELYALHFDCIRKDSFEHSYLKVELGKMNTERLVPIDEKIIALIKTIQTQSVENWKNRKVQNQSPIPQHLLIEPTGKRVKYYRIFRAYRQICHGIHSAEPLVPHRSRHTYATELLSAGMSHTSIMHILGHRAIGMTLRYAAVVPETARNEYLLALQKMNQIYEVPTLNSHKKNLTPDEPSFKDLIQWIRKLKDDPIHQEHRLRLQLISKRMHRLQSEINEILIKK
jgi:site-specific recombinase XerD